MAKTLIFLLLFMLLDEVGSYSIIHSPQLIHVKAKNNAIVRWEYKLDPPDEVVTKMAIGYFDRLNNAKIYIVIQRKDRPKKWITSGDNDKKYDVKTDFLSGAELTVKNVQLPNDGRDITYFCDVSMENSNNEFQVPFRTVVKVIDPPKIIAPTDSDHTVREKDKDTTKKIQCQVTGTPPPDVSWYKDGKKAKNGEGNNLLLYNLRKEDKGIYVCKASNIAGNASFAINLVIQYKPIINRMTSSTTVKSYIGNHHTVYLWCHAEGEPKPTFKWTIPFEADASKFNLYSDKLPIEMPGKQTFGLYQCKATNIIGNDTHIVTLLEIKPPSPVKINVTNIGRKEATALIHLPVDLGEGSLKEMVLSYARPGHSPKEMLIQVKRKDGVKRILLKDLIPYSIYVLDVTVTNDFFTSPLQNLQFMTKEDVPGPPRNVKLFSPSTNQLHVNWSEPHHKNGKDNDIFYRVVLRDVAKNVIGNPFSTTNLSLVINNLTSYTEYSVSVRTGNRQPSIGFGNWSQSVTTRTKAIAPSAPSNLTMSMDKEKKPVLVYNASWSPPTRQSNEKAPLTKYKIKSICTMKDMLSNAERTFETIGDLLTTAETRNFRIDHLTYFSTCEIFVCEGAGVVPVVWGEFSKPEKIDTPATMPDKPRNLRQSSSSHDHVWLKWDRPHRINGNLKEFSITCEKKEKKEDGGRRMNPSITKYYLEKDLTNSTFYYKLKLESQSNYTIEIIAHSQDFESAPVVIDVYTSQEPTPVVSAISKDGDGNAGPVVGGVLTVLFIIVLAAVILLYVVRKKKRFNRANSSNSDVGFFQKGDRGNIHLVDGPLSPPSITKSAFMHDYVKNAQCTFSPKNPIPITSLKSYVQKYHDSKAFIEEFRSIKSDVVGSLDISSRAENKCKNRYANILAYDHSRVVLNTVEDLEGSDYVNANYIDGYNKKAKFIATQGPVVAAFNDFWRMIWEQDADKIIMVTNLVEKSRIKCQKYWPCESESVLYGNIKVQMIEELPLAEYVVRRFSITQMKDTSEIASRTVTQYQFLSWPDHGVPHYPTALLQFVKRVRSLDQGTSGPIVCHCSAGVGRTGTYITLDAMLDQIEAEKTVDVVGYVTHIRGQRQLMVQTEAQYIYIYDTLLEAVSCGNTEVSTGDLFARIKHLDSMNPSTTQTYMQEEFERLSFNIEESDNYEAALLPCNEKKNRYPSVLPYELTRVKLWPYANIEGSDYINASFIDGYQQREAYILTQSPLETTVEDFWRMLWEYEVFTIVMISSPNERSKHHCYPYWPVNNDNNDTTLFGILAVQLAAEEEKVGFIRREFRVTNSKNGESRNISHFMYFNWPLDGSPDTASAIDMIGQVQKTQQQTGNSAIIIHCSDGSGRSGSLAALMYCLERLKLEGLVDIFQTVRQMRTQRVGLVQSLEQYHFIYMAVSNFLDCFSNYSNFK